MSTALSATESRDFARLEKTIEKGVKTFVAVGGALAEIKARKLYRERAETFQDYCQQVWGFTKQRAYQLIEAANVEQQLAETSTRVDSPAVPSERHARELARLPREYRENCLADAKAQYGDGLTAKQLRHEVDLYLGSDEPDEPAADDKPDELESDDEGDTEPTENPQEADDEAKAYRRPDTGEIVEVLPGIGDKWLVGTRQPNGSVRRLKSPALPPCMLRSECQAALDRYAEKKGWEEVPREPAGDEDDDIAADESDDFEAERDDYEAKYLQPSKRGFAADCRQAVARIFGEYADIDDPAADLLDAVAGAMRKYPQTDLPTAASLLGVLAVDIRDGAFGEG